MGFKKLYLWLIVFYLYWVSFEWLVFSFFTNYALVQLVRLIFDSFPLLFFVSYLLFWEKKVKLIHLNVILIYFLLLTLLVVSHTFEKTSLFPIIPYFGVTFRFVPLFLLSGLIDCKTYCYFITNVKIVYIVHLVFSLIELFFRTFFLKNFLPPESFFKGFVPTIFVDPGISSTFINTIDFSFFIIGLTILLLYEYRNTRFKWIVFAVSSLLVLFTFSVASVIVMFIIGLFLIKQRKYLIIILGFSSLFLVLFNHKIVFIFTGFHSLREYLIVANEYNRVGYFTKLLPHFFTSNLKDILLGYGVDPLVVDAKLKAYGDIPKMLTFGANNLTLLKDVYWISVLLTQGVSGLGLIFSMFYLIYRRARMYLVPKIFFFIKLLLLVTLVAGLFNQIFDLKGFCFFFWITIGIIYKNDDYKTTKSADCCA